METILVKVFTSQNTLLGRSPGIKKKHYILSLAGSLTSVCEKYDSNSLVESLREYKFQAISANESNSKFHTNDIHCIAAYNCDFIRSTLDYDLSDVHFGNESDEELPSRNFAVFLLFRYLIFIAEMKCIHFLL